MKLEGGEEDGGEAPSSKEEDEAEVVQLVGVVLRRSPARGRCFNGGRGERAPPWSRVERVRESEEVRESRGRRFPSGVGLG